MPAIAPLPSSACGIQEYAFPNPALCNGPIKRNARESARQRTHAMTCNIARFFSQHLSQPQQILYRHFVDERWRDVSVAEVATHVSRWQAAFRREGLVPGDRIALCARNGVTWIAADLAALALGLVVVPLYVDDNPENAAWCAGNAEAKLLLVENSRVSAALRAAAAGLPLPPLCVLRPDRDEAGTRIEAFLPKSGGDIEVRDAP